MADETLGPDLGFDPGAWDRLGRAVWIFDVERRRMAYANRAALRLWRAETFAELAARDFSNASEAIRIRTEAVMARLAQGESVRERCTFYPKGAPVTVDCLSSPVRLDGDRLAMLIEGAELEVTAQELRALEALRHASAMISLYDAGGDALFRNPAALAAQPADIADTFAARFDDPAEADLVWRDAGIRATSAIVRVRTAQGLRWHALDAQPTVDPSNGAPCVLVNERDITGEVEARVLVEHIATHDELTGLPNRALFHRRVGEALSAGGGAPAVLCLDLDRFKAVNDTLGHPVGDELLRAVAARLAACLGERDMAARFGGDEFVVLHVATGAPERSAAALARRIVEALCEPFELTPGTVRVGTSVGIALAPRDGASAQALIARADAALYGAKAAGRGTWRFAVPADAGPASGEARFLLPA